MLQLTPRPMIFAVVPVHLRGNARGCPSGDTPDSRSVVKKPPEPEGPGGLDCVGALDAPITLAEAVSQNGPQTSRHGQFAASFTCASKTTGVGHAAWLMLGEIVLGNTVPGGNWIVEPGMPAGRRLRPPESTRGLQHRSRYREDVFLRCEGDVASVLTAATAVGTHCLHSTVHVEAVDCRQFDVEGRLDIDGPAGAAIARGIGLERKAVQNDPAQSAEAAGAIGLDSRRKACKYVLAAPCLTNCGA